MKISVSEINRFFSCKLCGGYLVNPHCISECLHSFCKHCILEHFDRTAKSGPNCPTCSVSLGPLHAARSKLVFDRNIQSCIEKILGPVMSLAVRENKRKLEALTITDDRIKYVRHYKSRAREAAAAAQAESAAEPAPLSQPSPPPFAPKPPAPPANDIQFKVKLVPNETHTSPEYRLPPLPRPSFRAKFDVKVSKVQDFVLKRLEDHAKAALSSNEIEILFEGSPLRGFDLKELRNVFTPEPTEESVLILQYRRRL